MHSGISHYTAANSTKPDLFNSKSNNVKVELSSLTIASIGPTVYHK